MKVIRIRYTFLSRKGNVNDLIRFLGGGGLISYLNIRSQSSTNFIPKTIILI